MKFEEIYTHMAAEYKTLAGVEPEDAADVSIRLKVLAGELYTVLCAAESLKLNCFPQTAAGEALDLHAEERGLVRKDAVKSVGTLTFSRRTALSYAAEIPAGTAGFVFTRSGLGIKKGIHVTNGVGVIDSDYRGEIQIGLHNLSAEPYTVQPGERIAQMIIMPYFAPVIEEVTSLTETDRGAGGFGSTGTK